MELRLAELPLERRLQALLVPELQRELWELARVLAEPLDRAEPILGPHPRHQLMLLALQHQPHP